MALIEHMAQAYKRLQTCASRTHVINGRVVTAYELRPQGIMVRAQTPDLQHSGLVTWHDLETAEFEPLEAMRKKVVKQLQAELERLGRDASS